MTPWVWPVLNFRSQRIAFAKWFNGPFLARTPTMKPKKTILIKSLFIITKQPV